MISLGKKDVEPTRGSMRRGFHSHSYFAGAVDSWREIVGDGPETMTTPNLEGASGNSRPQRGPTIYELEPGSFRRSPSPAVGPELMRWL